MAAISVIIPFFNAKEYVMPCIESLCRQTIQEHIELVLIDDGSTDGSLSFIEKQLSHNGFQGSIVYIKQPQNLGVAEARKKGILKSSGDYIIFCDSDDWVDDNMYEIMLEKAESENYDMVVCDFMNIYSDKPPYISAPNYLPDMIQGLLLCKCSGSLCIKMVKRALFFSQGFQYPSHAFCEDFAYSIQLVLNADSIGYVPKPLYKYVHREGSIVQNQSDEAIKKRLNDNLVNHALVEQVIKNKGLDRKYASELIALRLTVKNSIRNHINKPGIYLKWLSLFPELTITIFKSRHISWRSRAAYFATMIGVYTALNK